VEVEVVVILHQALLVGMISLEEKLLVNILYRPESEILNSIVPFRVSSVMNA
jgi:hypothetical protein